MLPTWEVEQLPDPPKFSLRRALRMIGPGVILAGMAIGGGEWVLGFVLQPTGGDGCSRTALARHDLDGKPGGGRHGRLVGEFGCQRRHPPSFRFGA